MTHENRQLLEEIIARFSAEEKQVAITRLSESLGIEAASSEVLPDSNEHWWDDETRRNNWQRFVAGMKRATSHLPHDHTIDDSRESIYEGRGE